MQTVGLPGKRFDPATQGQDTWIFHFRRDPGSADRLTDKPPFRADGGADGTAAELLSQESRQAARRQAHAISDADGRLIGFFTTAGQVSDDTSAAALLSSLAKAGWLPADRGCDPDWLREALKDKGIMPSIPSRKSRGKPIKHDKRRYGIEIMFRRLKDWRRAATRYDRCPKVSLSAVALAPTAVF